MLSKHTSQMVSAYSTIHMIIGYFIRDLEGTGAAFDSDASTWTTTSPLGIVAFPYTTTCLGKPMLGGYNVLQKVGSFEKSYSSIPTHDIIYLRAVYYFVDGWESPEEGTKLYIDGNYVE